MENKILWKGKTEIDANIWGMLYEERGLTMSPIYGPSYSSGANPVARFIGLSIFSALGIFILLELSLLYTLIFAFFTIGFMVYQFFIREIKYYQLAKNTRYEITKDEIRIKMKYLFTERTDTVKIKDAVKFHLLRFNFKDGQKGTIYIYQKEKVKAYDIFKKERSHLYKIEMIRNFDSAYRLLYSILKEQNKKKVLQ